MSAVQLSEKIGLGRVIQFSLVIISIIVAVFLLFIPSGGNYDYMVLLPIGHCFLCIICFNLFDMVEKSVGRLIIIAGYTIRNVITPLLICLGGYKVATVPNPTHEAIRWASLVMLYESVVVFLFLDYYTKKHKPGVKTYKQLENDNSGFTMFSLISLGITVIMLLALVAVPAIRDSYKSLWATEDSVLIQKFSTIQDYSAGSFERLLYAFFAMFFSIMQIIWSIKLIEWIKKFFGQKTIAVLLSFGVLFLNTLVVSETNAYTIFVLVILGLNMLQVYHKKKKLIFTMLVIGTVAILFLMITARTGTGGGNMFVVFATFLNAYFPGIANASVLYNLEVPSKWVSFYFDIYGGIPLTSLIPPLMKGTSLLRYFQNAIGSSSQILSFSGQTFYYLSILGPIIQIIVVRFVMKFEAKARASKNNIEYLAYTTGMVLLAAGCTMYDISILVSFVLKTIIPFILLAKCKKIRIKF